MHSPPFVHLPQRSKDTIPKAKEVRSRAGHLCLLVGEGHMAYDDTLFQLGMDLTRSSTAQKEDHGQSALLAREILGLRFVLPTHPTISRD